MTNVIEAIEFILAIYGMFSAVLTVGRMIHNSKYRTWKNNVSIIDYPNDFDIEMNYKDPVYSKIWIETDDSRIIVYKSEDCFIKKLQVIALDFSIKTSELVEKEIIEQFDNISPEQAICFRLRRAEGIPQIRLKWFGDYGEYATYNLSDNLRNGITTIKGVEYSSTLYTKIRRAFGFI